MFILPALSFDPLGLKTLSARTIKHHYEGHHAQYVDELNALIKASPLRGATMSEILALSDTMRKQEGLPFDYQSIFNNATQHFAHSFYWSILGGQGETRLTERERGDVVEACLSLFGAGWVVMRATGEVASFKNSYVFPDDVVLAIDMWEHSYYLDWQEDKKSYVTKLIDEDIDWVQVGKYIEGERLVVPNE